MKKIDLQNIYLTKNISLLLLLIPIAGCFCHSLFLNGDSWFLFNHGRYVLEHGIPTIEPFTMHENFSFVMQQWLSSIIFYLMYSIGGKLGIAFLVVTIHIIMLYFLYKLYLLVSDKNYFLSYLVLFFVAVLLIPFISAGRPQIFSYVMYVLLLYFLESYVKTKNYKYLIGLPVISLLEINLHGSVWWLLLCFILPYIIESLYCYIKKKETYPLKPLLIFTGLMLLMGFFNPYGIDMMLYLFKSYGVYEINDFVSEMQVPDIHAAFGKAVFATLFIYLITLSKSKSIKIRYIFLILGTLYLLLSAYRNYPLFIIVNSFILVACFKDRFLNGWKEKLDKKITNVCYGSIMFLLIVSVLCINPISLFNKKQEMEGATNYLLKTVNDNKVAIYCKYDDGGYLEYYGFKPYIDTRAEVFLKTNNHKKDVFKEFYKLQNGHLLASEFLTRYDFDYFVVDKNDIVKQEIENNGCCELKYKDNYRYVYERIKE